jgi:hypothetical protein
MLNYCAYCAYMLYVCAYVLPFAPCETTDSHDHGMNVMTL